MAEDMFDIIKDKERKMGLKRERDIGKTKRPKGGWHICLNPKCGEKYHTDEKKFVDIPCSCLARSQQRMKEFNHQLTQY